MSMNFKKNYVYKIDYTEANMGYFYGIYNWSSKTFYKFIYITHIASKEEWESETFTIYKYNDSLEIINLGHIDEFKEQYPEYFI